MAYTTINKSTDYFRVKTYSGNSSTQSITWDESDNMKPDWLWLKGRGYSDSHALVDVIRGSTKNISSDSTTAEFTQTNGVTSFDTNGWSMGNWSAINRSTSGTAVGWGWLADNTTGSSNTDGSITSTVSANTTAGFSIVSWTGTGSAGTIGHGLGVTPKMYIIKKRDTAGTDWTVGGSVLGGTTSSRKMTLNGTGAVTTGLDASWWNSTNPTSSVISIGTQGDLNGSGATYIAYCFVEKTGYSKIGSYTGNGNADGTFVYTGFKPSFILRKCTTSSTAENWVINDNKRDVDNVSQLALFPNNSNVEDTATHNAIDICSNGFKVRTSDGRTNGNNNNYIYMAFGQSLVGSNNVPCTAR